MSIYSGSHQLTAVKPVKPLLSGIDAALYKSAGTLTNVRTVAHKLMRQGEQVSFLMQSCTALSDKVLKKELSNFREMIRRGGEIGEDDLLAALARVGAAAVRTLGMAPYTVQFAGALALYKGYIAEMATGEGKTLTAALCGVLRGFSGFPCHTITANDYLASRDAEKLSDLFRWCGLTVSSVVSTMDPPARRNAYSADVVYTTSKEIVADFLRDRLAMGEMQNWSLRVIRSLGERGGATDGGVVMRGIHTAIVDEADSLLIDEAVTPLIISRHQKNESFEEVCRAAASVSRLLAEGVHYELDHNWREVHIRDDIDFTTLFAGHSLPRIFSGEHYVTELLRQAVVAREFYKKDKQYVVQDDKVVIVDEFTGRSMPMRSWSAGLHQMIEAKENLPITPPNETLARLSFQRFFRFFRNLSGMTGTGMEASSEFRHVYGLTVVPVPRNKPTGLVIEKGRFFATGSEKWDAIIDTIESVHNTGRPVLIGTRSVASSEYCAMRLSQRGIQACLINAVRHQEEAAIIAGAGCENAVTVATNMAGRGTDILLGKGVREKGGLTNRNLLFQN